MGLHQSYLPTVDSCLLQLGCGTSLPSLILFLHALSTSLPLTFILQDYNASVLRLITLPNLLLVWASQHARDAFNGGAPPLYSAEYPQGTPITSKDDDSISEIEKEKEKEGDLEITPELLERFTQSLNEIGTSLALVSGPWNEQMSRLILRELPFPTPRQSSSSIKANANSNSINSLLILASETLYTPSSTSAFTSVLLALLNSVKMSKALVASKRVYFGTRGGVDDFKRLIGEGSGAVGEALNSGIEEGAGVGRVVLEVQLC